MLSDGMHVGAALARVGGWRPVRSLARAAQPSGARELAAKRRLMFAAERGPRALNIFAPGPQARIHHHASLHPSTHQHIARRRCHLQTHSFNSTCTRLRRRRTARSRPRPWRPRRRRMGRPTSRLLLALMRRRRCRRQLRAWRLHPRMYRQVRTGTGPRSRMSSDSSSTVSRM